MSAQFQIALAAFRRQDYATAYELARGILKGKRNDVNAITLLAEIAHARQDHPEELAQLTRAVKLAPKDARLRARLGNHYELIGEYARAVVQFEKALKLEPTMLSAAAGMAEVYSLQGKKDRARRLLEPHARRDPPEPRVVAVLMRLLISAGEIDEAVALGHRLLDRGDEPSVPARDACFQLARAYEQKGDYDEAFEVATRANAMLAPAFDPEMYRVTVDQTIEVFSREFLADAPRAETTSEVPVFIVGVPRCGSTLTERIIDVLPEAHGGGELRTMLMLIRELCARVETTAPFPLCAAELSPDDVEALSQSYLGEMARLAPKARRVTNKDLANFQHLGLINRLMPKARVIHCRRDPLDTCLSCFLQSFPPTSAAFTNDLRHLGLYYRQYERLMNHWRDVVDLEILDVDYEELVTEQETVTRRIVEFVGLPWDDACLQFHKTARADRTLSFDQVRKPLYRSSVGRAERFGARLDPLREALES